VSSIPRLTTHRGGVPSRIHCGVPISLADAEQLVSRAYPTIEFDRTEIVDYGSFWYFPVWWIGCCGVLVDRELGALCTLGSGLPIETWVEAYRLGLRYDWERWTITRVIDLPQAVELLLTMGVRRSTFEHLPIRPWTADALADRLRVLPATFNGQRTWQAYPEIVELARAGLPFEYTVEDAGDTRARLRVGLDEATFRAVADRPDLVLALERAQDRRSVDLIVPPSGWLPVVDARGARGLAKTPRALKPSASGRALALWLDPIQRKTKIPAHPKLFD
jgi:hypothetical protein